MTNLLRYIKYSKFEMAPFCHLNVMFSCLVSSNSTSKKKKWTNQHLAFAYFSDCDPTLSHLFSKNNLWL